jgi:hypothetical protein
MDKLEKLKKLINLVQNYSLNEKDRLNGLIELIKNDTITSSQLQEFLTLTLDVIKKSKDSFDELIKENQDANGKLVDFLISEHSKILDERLQSIENGHANFVSWNEIKNKYKKI